ncbi:MAG: hypothetical protein D6773_05570 [Alphaproteobacteria bacterium]|nr:MAG: hypothetical protein D6773_05570 [Alphaproteobacteria bacterium]
MGPTLGAAIALAAQGESLPRVTLTMAVFSTGIACVFLIIAYGFRAARGRTMALRGAAGGARQFFGWALIVVAILILTGVDKQLEAMLTALMPDWLLNVTTRF